MKNSMMDRLTTPMIRENGELRAAGWDEALDCAAEGLRRVKATYGPEGYGMFSCSKTTNELNFLAQKFSRVVMGSNNIDSCNRT
jgi:formate dehydrogenase (hydrogenase)